MLSKDITNRYTLRFLNRKTVDVCKELLKEFGS